MKGNHMELVNSNPILHKQGNIELKKSIKSLLLFQEKELRMIFFYFLKKHNKIKMVIVKISVFLTLFGVIMAKSRHKKASWIKFNNYTVATYL